MESFPCVAAFQGHSERANPLVSVSKAAEAFSKSSEYWPKMTNLQQIAITLNRNSKIVAAFAFLADEEFPIDFLMFLFICHRTTTWHACSLTASKCQMHYMALASKFLTSITFGKLVCVCESSSRLGGGQ
jgi:hypothetical protein